MANRYPLTLDTSDGQIKELPNGDNLNLTGNSIVGVLDVTAQGTITAATINVAALNINSNPLAEIATSGDYNDLLNKPLNLSDFANDANFVSIGNNISLLANDAGYLTSVSWLQLTNKPVTVAELGLVDSVDTTSPISIFTNDIGYVTEDQIEGIEVLTGNYRGSVFGDDSTILVDGVLNSFNLNGTVRSDIIPFGDNIYNIGSPANEFLSLYVGTVTGDLQGSVFSDDSSLTLIDSINNTFNGRQLNLDASDETVAINLFFEGTPPTSTIIGSIRNYSNGTLTHSILFTDDRLGIYSEIGPPGGYTLFQDKFIVGGVPLLIDPTDINNLSVPAEALEVVGNIKADVFKGDLIGSVFADNSTLLVDGVNGSIPASVIDGTIAQPHTKFIFTQSQPPNTPNSEYIGKAVGTWYECTFANAANTFGLSPDSPDRDPTLNGITFNVDRFSGFEQNSTYEFHISPELYERTTTEGIRVHGWDVSTGAFSSMSVYSPGTGTFNINGLSCNDHIIVTFEDANPANNWIRYSLDSDQGANYWIGQAIMHIKKIG